MAVRQRQGPQQLAHTAWPPALERIALGKQVADRLAAANEHGALPQQAGFIPIAIALKAGAGAIRIPKETVSSTPLSAGVLGRGRSVAGSRGTDHVRSGAHDVGSQPPPRSGVSHCLTVIQTVVLRLGPDRRQPTDA